MATDPQDGQRACADCKFRGVDRCSAWWGELCITMNPNANCPRWKPEDPKIAAPPPPAQPTSAIDLSPISTFGFWIAVGIVFSSLIAKVLP